MVSILAHRVFSSFSQCAQDFDAALISRGAQPVVEGIDSDDDYETEFKMFRDAVRTYLFRAFE